MVWFEEIILAGWRILCRVSKRMLNKFWRICGNRFFSIPFAKWKRHEISNLAFIGSNPICRTNRMLGPQQWGLFFYRGVSPRLRGAWWHWSLILCFRQLECDLERRTGSRFPGVSSLKWWKNQNMYDKPVCFRHV